MPAALDKAGLGFTVREHLDDRDNHMGEEHSIAEGAAPLQVLARLFERLNEHGIRYCHWKSTHALPKAMSGRTDLDLLVDRDDSGHFKSILHQLDYKPFLSHPHRQFPAIEDYLGFDAQTGRIVHLHIHYRLVLGEQFVKNYYLPLERTYLNHTRMHALGLLIPAAELELIVLALRALLKYRDRDVLADLLRLGRRPSIPKAILNELQALRAQTSADRLRDALAHEIKLVSPELIFKILDTLERAPRAGWTLARLRRQVRRELAPYQRYSRLRAQQMYFRIALKRQWPLTRFVDQSLKRKNPIAGGLTIAFVGPDGSGKSTVVKHIRRWLAWRVNVRPLYMGTTQPSRGTRMVKMFGRLPQVLYAACRRVFGRNSLPARMADGPRRLFEYLRYLAEARDRLKRFRSGQQAAARGAIAIYDRYPLAAVQIMNHSMDGPRIASSSGARMGWVARAFARVEERMYRQILPPEHLFALQIRPEVSLARKPEHRRAAIEAKSQAMAQVMRADANVIVIDAEQPLEQVLLQIKSALWRLL
jgi:thymidylate kinase